MDTERLLCGLGEMIDGFKKLDLDGPDNKQCIYEVVSGLQIVHDEFEKQVMENKL